MDSNEETQNKAKKPIRLIVFSTEALFDKELSKVLNQYTGNATQVEIFLLKAQTEGEDTFLSRCLALRLRKKTSITKVVNTLKPPKLTDSDIVLDAIATDPDLLPLVGGYLAVERYITGSEASIIYLKDMEE